VARDPDRIDFAVVKVQEELEYVTDVLSMIKSR